MGLLAAVLMVASCHTPYEMSGITRTRIVVDSRYDTHPDGQAAAFLAPYRHQVDSIMSPVVGTVARYMAAHQPESELSNLLPDILMWCGPRFQERPDFAVYNMGGIRAAFAQGKVTYGNVLDVAPFENKICFLSLSGDKVTELFGQMAARGGEGVSHGVELVITRSGKLVSARLNGQPIDPARTYRVVTLDYLSHGNDQMIAFKSGTDVVLPKGEKNNVRFLIMDFFREQTRKGIVVDSRIEGRIKVENS